MMRMIALPNKQVFDFGYYLRLNLLRLTPQAVIYPTPFERRSTNRTI